MLKILMAKPFIRRTQSERALLRGGCEFLQFLGEGAEPITHSGIECELTLSQRAKGRDLYP